MTKTNYINQLNSEVQEEIRVALVSEGLEQEDIDLAMDSRLCDLEDTIDINKYL